MRKGLGRGKGKGYKNIIGRDPRVHSMSAKGMKQPQRLKPVGSLGIGKTARAWDDLDKDERDYFMMIHNINNDKEYDKYMKGFKVKVNPKKNKIRFYCHKCGEFSDSRKCDFCGSVETEKSVLDTSNPTRYEVFANKDKIIGRALKNMRQKEKKPSIIVYTDKEGKKRWKHRDKRNAIYGV